MSGAGMALQAGSTEFRRLRPDYLKLGPPGRLEEGGQCQSLGGGARARDEAQGMPRLVGGCRGVGEGAAWSRESLKMLGDGKCCQRILSWEENPSAFILKS